MSITRTTAANHLHGQFENLAREIKQLSNGDNPTGYGPDVDAALRRLGKTQEELATATVDDGSAEDYFALAEYYCLRRILRRVATKVNIDANALAPEGNRNQVFKNVKDLFDMAKETIEALGYSVGDDTAWEFVRLGLDFVEPEVSDA